MAGLRLGFGSGEAELRGGAFPSWSLGTRAGKTIKNMDLQEKIIKAINDNRLDGDGNVNPDAELGFIQSVLSTSLLKVENFPAVIVEDEAFDFSETDNGVIGENQACTVYLITESKNVNELTDEDYCTAKADAKTKMRTIVNIVGSTARVTFGRADIQLTLIDGNPMMVVDMGAKGLIIN